MRLPVFMRLSATVQYDEYISQMTYCFSEIDPVRISPYPIAQIVHQ